MLVRKVGTNPPLTLPSGGERAARDLEILREKDIKAVVNCTDDIKNYHEGTLSYYKFNIAWWRKYVGNTEELVTFLSPVLKYIENEIENGRNVFVSTLAPAGAPLFPKQIYL